MIEVIALVYSETFSWIYLKTDLTFTRLNMIYSIIRGLLVDIPLIVASAGVILLTRKSFKAHEKRELSFSKNWNIVGVSTVLWLIVGYLFAAAPSFLTEGNIKYIYGYYKYDSEPYQYRLSFWIAFGLAVIASTLMLFALRRSTEELSKGFGLFSSGLFVQALGMFLIRWTINDFSWLHVALVGLGFGISLTGMAVLLVRIITSSSLFNPLSILLGPLAGVIFFYLFNGIVSLLMVVVVLNIILAVIGIGSAILSSKRLDPLHLYTRLGIE